MFYTFTTLTTQKIKILKKLKITHVKKVGQTSYFFLAFINELEEEIIIKKTAEMGR